MRILTTRDDVRQYVSQNMGALDGVKEEKRDEFEEFVTSWFWLNLPRAENGTRIIDDESGDYPMPEEFKEGFWELEMFDEFWEEK